ncbi:uncharacterized protein LOC120203061 [Hibiscus syriacus]|uniref:uncharacterized protein LOC120203061 n=1 Tax=Hibiscus syriacus TaxID=106335 RepID=UPI001923C149|nr:uncharacterized protein LOC120203061 [Hibiscus syriacus]
MGCMLGQHDNTKNKDRAIYNLNKKFIDCETRFDLLKYLMGVSALFGRLAQWKILLSKFDIQYVSQKIVKRSSIVDFIPSRASKEYKPLSFDFPDEDLMAISVEEATTSTNEHWKLNFDGALNALGHGIGAILILPNEEHYPFTSRLNFDFTNNMVDYEACVLGLKAIVERKIKTLKVYEDSDLIIYQLRGEWETKDPKLVE